MPAPPTGPEPQPEPRPLSEREERALRELQAGAVAEDPALSLRLRRTSPSWRSQLSPRAYNAIVQIAVVYVLALVVLPRPWAGALLAIGFMLVPTTIAFWSIRRDSQR
ncbi:MAG TPA: DUF3040 domain-containing protein [Actinomycetospora sp.]|nr:DUF3040 domain-containing protein [Actinomycetospora sp.]